jgi:hypothetical protein
VSVVCVESDGQPRVGLAHRRSDRKRGRSPVINRRRWTHGALRLSDSCNEDWDAGAASESADTAQWLLLVAIIAVIYDYLFPNTVPETDSGNDMFEEMIHDPLLSQQLFSNKCNRQLDTWQRSFRAA